MKEKLLRRLGGWENPDMVLRYTKWVKFEDRLKLYRRVEALSSPNPRGGSLKQYQRSKIKNQNDKLKCKNLPHFAL